MVATDSYVKAIIMTINEQHKAIKMQLDVGNEPYLSQQ